MNILITGSNGSLGHYLVPVLLLKGHHVIATGRGACRLPLRHEHLQYCEMDITDPFSLHDVFQKYQPDVVVHAAAVSKPDECEQDQSMAYSINVEATVQLLLNAEEHKSFFIFISTDFIFDGKKGMYKEDDVPGPVNFYGRTKLEAEEAVRDYAHDWCIVRTVLVYGKPPAGKSNLLTIVKEKLEGKQEYAVVDDQVRTPTYAGDLAVGIAAVIERRAKGIFHISGAEQMTPYQMACTTAKFLNLDSSLLKKATAKTFSQPAERPLLTGFNIEKAGRELDYNPMNFVEGITKCFEIRY
jgi:dTDP-4-dehydrorhamnose reductase